MTNFKYFTLAPHDIDESTQQYVFEGGIEAVGTPPAVNFEYRFVYDLENEENGASEWQTYSVGETITHQEPRWFGVQFRNDSGNFTNSSSNYYHIKSTHAFDAGGKIMSLINFADESAALPDYAFCRLFSGTQIHDARELILPDRVSNYCYQNTFNGCSSLTAAPALPATSLANSCYAGMFWNCSSLQTTPALPATSLYNRCYEDMFNSCTSLTTAPALPATSLADYCYNGMLKGCSSLTPAPELPATTLKYCCYQGMLEGCTSLTESPALIATNLATYCYAYMFNKCSKIERIIWKSPGVVPTSTYCINWMLSTPSSGKFEYTDPSLNVASISRSASGVPAGWSISLLSPETKLLLKINNASVDTVQLFGKKISSLSINGKKVKSSSAA